MANHYNAGVDCDWENDGTNVWTGTSDDNCPVPGNVGIGIISPTTAKLYVDNSTFNGDPNTGLQVSSVGQLENITGGLFRVSNTGGSTTTVTGINCIVNSNAQGGINSPQLMQGLGVRLYTGLNTIGVRVNAAPSVGGQNIGLGGYFNSQNIPCTTKVYAIHGVVGTSQNACGGWQNSNHWAGFFEGAVFSSVNFYPSDENLKENINEFESPLEKVLELNPLQYNFLVEENPALSLPGELQHGFLASELEEVFPHLVRNVSTPSRYDSVGVIIQESQSLKAINYNGIIPINTAAIQEQQGIIQNQQNQINELQSTVNELMALVESCCAQMDDAKTNTPGNDIRLNQEKTELKQNRPNPFEINTTIDYSLAEGGEVVLAVYNDKGQLVAQLDQGLKASGSYSVLWSANNISQGVYYYSLKVNGVELVKKAVKL